MKLTKIAVLATSLMLAGCSYNALQARPSADAMDASSPFKLCLYNHGIEPESMFDCMRQANNQEQFEACVPDQHIAEGCALAEDARREESTTSCDPNLFGGITCAAN